MDFTEYGGIFDKRGWSMTFDGFSTVDNPTPFAFHRYLDSRCQQPYDHVYTVYNSSYVDIIIHGVIDDFGFGISHPFHLHGNDFWVLGVQDLWAAEDRTEPLMSVPAEEVRVPRCGHALTNGGCAYDPEVDFYKLNFVNPPLKDTVNVPVGGWAYLRFKADNPGVWFFHCHIGHHMEEGMRAAFNIMPYDQPQIPASMPAACGVCRSNTAAYSACDYCSSSSSSSCSSSTSSTCSGTTTSNTVNINFANLFNGLALGN